MNVRKNKKGITLVALVVTIVVLLILAGISLSLILGNYGVITKANEGRANYANASVEEQEMLNTTSEWIDNYAAGKEGAGGGGNLVETDPNFFTTSDNGDGTLTITGIVKNTSKDPNGIGWYYSGDEYNDPIIMSETNIVIPKEIGGKKVTAIGKRSI